MTKIYHLGCPWLQVTHCPNLGINCLQYLYNRYDYTGTTMTCIMTRSILLLSGIPKAVIFSDGLCLSHSLSSCACSVLKELAQVKVHALRNLSPQSKCLYHNFKPHDLVYKNDICWRFHRSSALTYLTHLYYFANWKEVVPFRDIDQQTPDITMVTVLTLTRFKVFVKTVRITLS